MIADEIIQTFEIELIIADTKWINALPPQIKVKYQEYICKTVELQIR
jgi:hypothetical protein